jgi:flagellar hook protein FlgE
MFAGVSGLRNHQVKMDVIGNNIANVNTVGYKMSRATFQEMYSQTLRGASSPTGISGGTNPLQIGLGASTASIDVIHEQGGAQSTDRPLDFYIDGEGFFCVSQGDDMLYTRAGNLYLDDSGFLVTANGMYVQGFCMLDDAYLPAGFDATMLNQITKVDADALDPDEMKAEMSRIFIPDSEFSSFSVDKNGLISAIDKNNQLVPIGQILTANFVNPGGLTRVGNSLYERSNNSGGPQYKRPDTDGAGKLVPGTLEMSNVDLSKEFTDMIITQRGFQANSRVITVSDTLLEELINLKR